MFNDPNIKSVEVLNSPMKGIYVREVKNNLPEFESDKIKVFVDLSINSISVVFKDSGNYVFENNELPTWELESSNEGNLKIRFIDYNE